MLSVSNASAGVLSCLMPIVRRDGRQELYCAIRVAMVLCESCVTLSWPRLTEGRVEEITWNRSTGVMRRSLSPAGKGHLGRKWFSSFLRGGLVGGRSQRAADCG